MAFPGEGLRVYSAIELKTAIRAGLLTQKEACFLFRRQLPELRDFDAAKAALESVVE